MADTSDNSDISVLGENPSKSVEDAKGTSLDSNEQFEECTASSVCLSDEPVTNIPSEYLSFLDNGQNATSLLCQRCSSIVLRPRNAKLRRKQISLPHMRKKSEQDDTPGIEEEMLDYHWLISDMYTFENVGFLKTIGTSKYLICADCEIGPIGWHDITNKNEFYVALDRIEHKD